MKILRHLCLLALPLVVGCATTSSNRGHFTTQQVVDTVRYGAEPLRITLSSPPVCCGEAQTGEGASRVNLYLKSSDSEGGASFKILLGLDDQAVVLTSSDGRGLYDQELFRSESLPRNESGELVMEIPQGILPSRPMVLWRAHAVPTEIQGVVLGNPRAGSPRPVVLIEQEPTSRAADSGQTAAPGSSDGSGDEARKAAREG